MMILLILIVSNIIQFYFLIAMLFYFTISIAGFFFYWKKNIIYSYSKRFAILIPSHNEERVIGNLLESLKYLDYPQDLYDVYVICDHCTDRTEEIARNFRVNIFSYNDNLPSNKARALNRATMDILKQRDDYDAFCYFDADSLVHPSFLKSMSGYLEKGALCIQGRQLPKNKNDSLISMIVSSGQFITNIFFQKPKEMLGLSSTLHGKGMCFDVEIVKKFKWDEYCLTEDLEMQMNLVKNGIRINWCENAIVYDEQPSSLFWYMRRSIRWTRGSLDTAKKHAIGLLMRFINGFDLKSLEAFIYCIGVYRTIMVFFVSISIYLTEDKFNLLLYLFYLLPHNDLYYKIGFILLPFFLLPLSLIFEKNAGLKMFFSYFLQPALGFLRIPIFVFGIVKDRDFWDRTEHISNVRIMDILKNNVEEDI